MPRVGGQGTGMKFGVAVTTSVTPAVTAGAQADYVRRMAEAIEDAGFDSVWVSDRTLFPADLARRYPDMFGPGRASPEAQNVLESLATLSFVGGATRRVRLGVSVLVLPFRNPLLNAKMITTLDVLSGGRVIYGVGVGWMPEEFASMGAPYRKRGALTDEHIEIFKAACTQDVPEYRGKHFRTSGMVFFPRPVQEPHPPIWVGGNSRFALRRSVRLGDAWHGIRLSPRQVRESRRDLARICRAEERDPGTVGVTLRHTLVLGEPRFNGDGQRLHLTGAAAQVRDDVRRYREAGLDYLVLSVDAPSTGKTLDAVRRFADEILED